ncbi:MAG: ABC transporter permease [Pseudomonadota bacterium]|nr:ABC transporter permease [Pseudomonadota bacterium]
MFFADIEVTTMDPWGEINRILIGIVTPNFSETDDLIGSIATTIAFAILGVALGNFLGFFLALAFYTRAIRLFCAFVRSIHELFWALIFLQVFGLSAVTGILALAIPYSGIFAKVYSEILDESDRSPLQTISKQTSKISIFIFVRLPDAWAHFKTYSLYRLECGLRSSAVLGFIGLPTMGFHLETAFAESKYSEASAILIIFFVIIATIRKWTSSRLIPFYILISAVIIPWNISDISIVNFIRFFSHDIIPYPIRVSEKFDLNTFLNLLTWLKLMVWEQAIPGTISTIILSQIALVTTGILTLIFFPLISPKFFKPLGRTCGHILLVVVRSTPEYILALVFLLLWGPSMLPAIVALSLHNGAIIGHLIGRYTETLKLRIDRSKGVNLYFFEILPNIYGQFLAFLFYRWEVIIRETAILGILGITTLGFYIDDSFADLRFDRAMVLILITAAINIAVDLTSRKIRAKLNLQTKNGLV